MTNAHMSKAASDVLAERHRQIESKGWTQQHDDEHDNGYLGAAAAGYAFSAACVIAQGGQIAAHSEDNPPEIFPPEWRFKPGPPRAMLVKAAALILAEIERLDRMKHSPKPYLDWHGDPFPGKGNDWMKHCLERPIKRKELAGPSRKYGIDNPPRLRKPGESLHEYRIAMGWESQSADDRQWRDEPW